MPITYEEYKKKYKKQIQERKEQERQKRANQNKYQKINENQQKTVQNLRTKVVQEQDKQQLYKPVFTTQKDQIKYLTETAKERAKNPLPKQQEIKKFSVYNQELENKKKQIEEYEKTSDTYKKYKDEVNKGIYTKYLANQERVNNENVTTMDKLNVFRPLLVGLESGIDPGQYRLENGAIVDLPSYNELKQQKVQSEMGVIGQSIHGAVESIGHMAPAMLTSALPVVGPVAGVATTFLTSFNSAQNQKLLEGYDIKEANAYATVNAGLEATLSKLMGGVSKIIGGKQTFLTKNLDKLTSKIIKNDGVRYFTSHLLAEEAEELTQMVLDPINEHITLGEYKNIGEALSTLNADETLITALSTLVTMGLTEGPSSVSVGKLSKTINQINKQYGTDFKLKTETNQIIDNKTNEDATNRFNELRKKSQISKVQEQQLIELETRAEQLENDRTNGLITEQEYLQEAQKISNEAKIFSEEQNNNKINPITEIEVEKENLNEQLNNNQITEQEYEKQVDSLNKKLKEIAGEDISDAKYSQNKKQTAYQYINSDNEKINNMKQSASKYFDNTKSTHELINTYEKIIADKNYNVLFDDTITNIKGESVNAKITTLENGEVEIRINPNSERAGEFLIMHEVTHAIETDSLKQLVMDFAERNKEFKKDLTDLKQAYGTEDVSSEVLADISGQLLGNQEFINGLKMQNTPESKNIIKQIYETLVRILNKLTTKGRYRNFVQNLETKWREAYRTQENNLKGTHFAEIYKNDGTFDRVRITENIFDNNNGKSINQTIKKYLEQHIGEVYTIIESGQKIYLGEDLPGEYAYSKSAESLPTAQKLAKGRASSNLKEIIENASNRQWQKNKKEEHKIDAKYGFYRYDTNFSFEYKGKEKIYKATILIRNDANGKKYLYDILNIRPQKKLVNLPSVASNSSMSSAMYDGSSNQLNNNISQNNKNVKSDISTKYSMQENTNDTQELDNSSFSLEKLPKVKDGYTRLYRGLNNKYDSNYDRSKLDSPNGYDTLTDNYDLAKQYGNNVYYIDIPTNQISNSVIDENPNSETYGDRNLAYKNDKPAGLNGVSGNEYLLYTDHDNFNSEDYHEISENGRIEYSISDKDNNTWQEHLEKNYKATGTRTNFENIKLPTKNNIQNENNAVKLPKIENPLEISKLTKEDANTTPPLPKKTYKKGNEQSSFYKNITEKSEFLNKDFREMMKNEENIQYYQEITNENTLKEAYEKLQEGGMEETAKWFNKDVEKGNITAIDVAEGWILLKQYQDAGDYQSTVEVAKKMRNIGTKAGQTVQAFNIMNRLTPEGMVYYAQSELSEAYNIMVKNKTKKWIDQNASKFDLTTSEVQFIIDTMNEVKDMQDGYEKRVKLAEIQKVLTDKLPPERGAGIKSWMRISMLLNPKTQVRNVMGNAIIAPINTFSDLFASAADKIIAKKTGHRTTGNTNVKNYLKGFKEGAYQSYNDFKKGINTRNMQGNRFEVSEGKAFNNDTIIGKKLNQADNFLSFVLDAGDRTFYEATFTNSINNQLKLNNTTEVTPEMIDIATTEALQRTWQDNNEYTKAVLSIRKMLNKANVRGYGLGDVLIPFAKTPANLTKAIVDYSPVGLTKTLVSDAKQLKNSLENGQYNPQLQHRFVQNLGKGIAGSFLYIIGTALAKAGITTGENDEDKDVANFMRNSVGINSYSINIGNKSFSYDWAQPIAAPLAIMANYTKQSKENPEANIIERTLGVLDSGFDVLLAQSFLDTINEVLNGNGTPTERLQNAILDLPARAVPTFMKQIADMVDSTTRTSFEYDKPLKTAVNKVVAKVPVLSKTLEPSIDTLGNTTLKYGGKNNLFNVFINPANINKGKLTPAGAEIYRLYEETGDSTIMPRVAPYYINNKGEKIILTNQQKTEFQKISGNIIEENVLSLLNDSNYQKMNDIDKASVVNELVNFSYNKARKEVLGLEMSQTYNRINKFMAVGGTPAQFYATKDTIDSFAGKNKKQKIINYIESQPMTIEQKAQLIKMKYPSFETYDTNIINYINKQSLSISEKTELLELLGFEVRNGKVYK